MRLERDELMTAYENFRHGVDVALHPRGDGQLRPSGCDLVKEIDGVVRDRDYLYDGLNKILHPNGACPACPASCDLLSFLESDLRKLLAEREAADALATTVLFHLEAGPLVEWLRQEVSDLAEKQRDAATIRAFENRRDAFLELGACLAWQDVEAVREAKVYKAVRS
jgi:hypothetical protein